MLLRYRLPPRNAAESDELFCDPESISGFLPWLALIRRRITQGNPAVQFFFLGFGDFYRFLLSRNAVPYILDYEDSLGNA